MLARSLPRFKSSFTSNLATLRVHGPDCKGIVATCSNILDQQGYEIVGTEHWTDRKENLLFLRIAFAKESESQSLLGNATSTCSSSHRHHLEERGCSTENDLQRFCEGKRLSWTLNWRGKRKKIAVFVSKYDHCLWELLLRREAHELVDCEIVAVVSNHDNLRPVAETFGIPYHVYPITLDNKDEQGRRQVQLLKEQLDVDIVVLARYMQVLTDAFLEAFPSAIINIHHSFLPAFSGSRPYHAAFERGVKLIGATAHYTTAELDQGPIIEQDVISVTHRDGVDGLIQKGRILERNVLVRALQAHLEDRVIVYKNKCVVFSGN